MRKTPFVCLALLAFGCAGQPAPTEQVARSMAAISAAREAGATEVPAAALHFRLAEEQLAEAKRVMNDDGGRAEGLALRAAQDAELSRVLARENVAKQRVQQIAQSSQSAGGEQPASAPSAPQRAQ